MENHHIIFTFLFLCAVTSCIRGNAGNVTQPLQPRTTSGHNGSELHPEQHAAKEPQAEKNEENSGKSQEVKSVQPANLTATDQSSTTRYNNTYRPNFRRYIDLRKNMAIVEARIDDSWIRLRPTLKEGEVQEKNVTRYIHFPNGTRIALRSKFDYSYDDVNWFHSNRIRIPISQFANGTILYQYRFGPKRWLSSYRNRFFLPNADLSQMNMGPAHANAANGTAFNRNQGYKYGSMMGQTFGPIRYSTRYYDRYNHRPLYNHRGWNQRGSYSDYYGRRPAYAADLRYPYYNDARYHQEDGGQGDRGYRPASAYDEPRYAAPGGGYDDRRHYSGSDYGDGRYRSEGYQSARGYDDKRYYADHAYDDRKYPPQTSYNEPSYRTYDTKDPSERGSNYDTRRYDRGGYDDSLDRRRDR